MRSNRGWTRVMLMGVLLLNACAPVAVVEKPPVPTVTPGLAVPEMVVATFTPVSEPAPVSAPALSDASVSEADTSAATDVLSFTYHTVSPGDTLLGLALKYGLPMAAIQLQNDLGTSLMLQAGQVLEIPPVVGWEGASPFWVVYEVQAGDVLSTIAADYGFDVATLQNVNGLADADLLSIGQALILPLDAPAEHVLAQNRPTATPAPLPAATQVIAAAAAPVATADVTTVSAAPATATLTPSPPVAAPVLPADVAEFPAAIFRLINEQRAAYGLAPLAWNATLARAAQLHADDCYARGWCSHTGSDGSTMKERIIRQGYDPVRWSECWAWYATPEMAVAMWMDETPPNDPHRRTILSTWLTEVGVGVVPASNGRGYYFIADFGTPR